VSFSGDLSVWVELWDSKNGGVIVFTTIWGEMDDWLSVVLFYSRGCADVSLWSLSLSSSSSNISILGGGLGEFDFVGSKGSYAVSLTTVSTDRGGSGGVFGPRPRTSWGCVWFSSWLMNSQLLFDMLSGLEIALTGSGGVFGPPIMIVEIVWVLFSFFSTGFCSKLHFLYTFLD